MDDFIINEKYQNKKDKIWESKEIIKATAHLFKVNFWEKGWYVFLPNFRLNQAKMDIT